MDEEVKTARDFIERAKERTPDIIISDVPADTKKWFRTFGNSDEFRCNNNKRGHYGFALKFLCDFYRGRIMDGSAIAQARADQALQEIAELKSEMAEPKEEVITLVGGRKIIKR